jgi:hypothetical protein
LDNFLQGFAVHGADFGFVINSDQVERFALFGFFYIIGNDPETAALSSPFCFRSPYGLYKIRHPNQPNAWGLLQGHQSSDLIQREAYEISWRVV